MSGATTTTEAATDMLQERLIDAEYKIWKKNTPYLYDFVMTHSLEWPSLTCQWLPTKRILNTNSSNKTNRLAEHQVLLGTHTTGEQNHLMVATCVLLDDDHAVVSSEQQQQASSNNGEEEKEASQQSSTIQYDEEKKEVGGFGLASSDVGKIEIKMKIKHEGEVNRARYMPQNHFIVATRGPAPEIYIWDMSKHPSFPDEQSPFCPQMVCVGHEKEGYALGWSPLQNGHLLSGSEDTTVKLWDVQSALTSTATTNNKGETAASAAAAAGGAKNGTQIHAKKTFRKHTDIVEDVAWHGKDSNMMGSVGDDKRLCLWDIRDESKTVHCVENAHDSDINCLSFNPLKEYILATGSADSTIAVWDMRNLKQPMTKLLGHSDQVFKVDWAPFNESILGSCSADRRVGLWDLSRIGQEQSPEDAEDGPPELLFLHGGHTSKVSDFSWNTKHQWSIASVSEDNVLQVWNPAEEIYADDDDDDDDDDDGEDAKAEDGVLGEDELE